MIVVNSIRNDTNPSKGVNNRVLYLDALRFMATFAVVVIHVSDFGYQKGVGAMGEWGWRFCSLYDHLSHWAVPIFLMISGALFLSPDKEVGLGVVFRRLLPRLAVPYFFWWFFYVALTFAVYRLFPALFSSTFSVDNLRPYYHLWYLPMLAGIYLIIPLLKLLVSDPRMTRYFLLLWVVVTTLKYIPFTAPLVDSLYIELTLGYSGFFVLGHFLSTAHMGAKARRGLYWLSVFAAIAMVAVDIVFLHQERNGKMMELCSPQIALLASAIFVWAKYADWQRWRLLIGRLRPLLFGIYLVHLVWVIPLTRDFVYTRLHPAVYVPLCSVVVFLLSMASAWLISKMPLLRRTIE